jgi:hypothetical protein
MTAAGGVGNLLDLSSYSNDNGCVHASHGILMRGGIPSAILCARQRKINAPPILELSSPKKKHFSDKNGMALHIIMTFVQPLLVVGCLCCFALHTE